MGNRASEFSQSERCAYASKRQVAEYFGISPNTVNVWVKEYGLPAPVKLAPQTHRWRWSEVLDWEASRERVAKVGA
jgi:predicted DNA-binding transcriptional regulator AlpA